MQVSLCRLPPTCPTYTLSHPSSPTVDGTGLSEPHCSPQELLSTDFDNVCVFNMEHKIFLERTPDQLVSRCSVSSEGAPT